MKDYHEVAENVFRRRDEYETQKAVRRQNWQKITASLSAFAIVIAFLFTAGTCYVFAVGLGIVEDTFGIYDKFFTVAITQKQQDAVKSAAVPLGQTVTSDGISVTAQSAFTDGTTAYVLLKIVAPEHIDLDQYGIHFNIDDRGIIRGDNPSKRLGTIDGGTAQSPLDDHDGAKNTMEMRIRFNTVAVPGGDFSYADGYDRYLMLEGLYMYGAEYPFPMYQISDGEWNFRIRFDDSFSNTEKEMLDAPITMKCRRAMYRVWQTATVHSVVVKGLGVTLRYTYDAGAVQEPGDFALTIKVVLTDGTIIDVHGKSGSKEDNGEFVSNFLAAAPILVEDIAYIQIGETIIGANQTAYQEKEMLDAPVNIQCHNDAHNITQVATVHSIITKGFSVTLRYTYDTDAVQEPGYFGDIKVVLTDGTVIKTREDLSALGDNGEFTVTFMADAPILAENIDYIQIGETIIPANQPTN